MQDLPSFAGAILRSIVIQSPVLLVWLVGALIALIRLPKHAAVSLLMLIAFGLMFLGSLGSAVVYAWLPHLMEEQSWLVERVQWVYGAVGLATCILYAVAWVLILFAVFGWREGSRRGSQPIDSSSPFSA